MPTGYDVQYTLNPLGDSPDWTTVDRSGTETSQTITGLENGQLVWVRVRGVNANGKSNWVQGTGRPKEPTRPGEGPEVWAARLKVQTTGNNKGCSDVVSNAECSSTSVLSDNHFALDDNTDNDFTYNGVDYRVGSIQLTPGGNLSVTFDKAIPHGFQSLKVGGTDFSLASGALSGADRTITWTNSGLTWSVGQWVPMSLTVWPRPTGRTLAGVRVCWDTSAGGNFAECGAGRPKTYGYKEPALFPADGADATHVKVTPYGIEGTTEIKVGKVTYPNGVATVTLTPVKHGTQSAAICLSTEPESYGITNIRVQVTHRSGRLDTYTVSIQKPPDSAEHTCGTDSPGVQGPTAVSLALSQDRVQEDVGQVTLTATLDGPAPAGGLDLRVYAANESTAEEGVDYTIPANISIPTGGLSASTRIRITDDALDESDESVVIGVITDTLDATLTASATLTIVDDDPAAQRQEQTPRGKYADLIAQMYEWRNGPEAQQYGKPHTDRWDRALLAFGETVADATLTPMTAAEAQALADQDWGTRWVPVAAALWEIENRAPTVSSAIGDVTIANLSGMQQVSLSGTFSDADSDALTITAASSDEAVATVSVASDQSSLTVTAQAQGTATVTVRADDGKGGTVSDAFTVEVKAAPVVVSAIANVSLEVGATREVSLSGAFSDADGDALIITAASSDEAVATLTVASDGPTLTLAGVAEGTATITVTAEDSDGNRVSDAFDVTVTAAPPEEDDPPASGGPTVAAPVADFSLEGPEHREIDLSDVFQGDGLRFSAVSSNYRVASMWVDGTTLTVVAPERERPPSR